MGKKESQTQVLTAIKISTYSTLFIAFVTAVCAALLGGFFVAATAIGLNQIRIASVSQPQALIPGLIGSYVFNDNASAVVGPNGVIYGSPQFVTDSITGKALKIDGKEGISVTPGNTFRTEDATWSTFIKREDTGSSSAYRYFLSYGVIRDRFLVGTDRDGNLRFYDDINYAGDSQIISQNVFTVGEWKHLAIVFTKDGKKKAYVNGELIGEDATGVNLMGVPYSKSTFNIGSSIGGSNFLKGTMDDVSIFNRALNKSEIKKVCGGLCGQVIYEAEDYALPAGSGGYIGTYYGEKAARLGSYQFHQFPTSGLFDGLFDGKDYNVWARVTHSSTNKRGNYIYKAGHIRIADPEYADSVGKWKWVKFNKINQPSNFIYSKSDFNGYLILKATGGGSGYLYLDKVMVTDDLSCDPNVEECGADIVPKGPPIKALVYKFDNNFNFEEKGLLEDFGDLTIGAGNHISLYFAGPASRPEHADLRIAGEEESYLRWKVFKDNKLIDDFILQVGGTDRPYLRYSLEDEGAYKIELYQCPVNVIADINYSQHPYYSQLSPEEAQFYFKQSLDLFKMKQSYLDKYESYSQRCLDKVGESDVNLRYSVYAGVQTPVTTSSSIGKGSCTMADNKSALDSSSKPIVETKSYSNVNACFCTVKDEKPVFSISGERTPTFLGITYPVEDEKIKQCELEYPLGKIKEFKTAIKQAERLAEKNYVEYWSGTSYVDGGIVDLLEVGGVYIRKGFENDPQIRDCTSEKNLAYSSIRFDSTKQCPPIIDSSYSYSSFYNPIPPHEAKAKSGSPGEYYKCAVERLKQLHGKYLCELSGSGIISWQADFEGYKCDKVNQLGGLKARAAYTGGSGLSLSKDEETQLATLSYEERLKVYFDISKFYYLEAEGGGAYNIAKEYYGFKDFDAKYVPSWKNDILYQCSIPGCSEGGHCSGMSQLAQLFYQHADFIGSGEKNISEGNLREIMDGLIDARPWTGRYKINAASLSVVIELDENLAGAFCHAWQVNANGRHGWSDLPDTFPFEFNNDLLADMDRDYFYLLSILTTGHAPIIGIWPWTENAYSHAVLVVAPLGSGKFKVYNPNIGGTEELNYSRDSGYKLQSNNPYGERPLDIIRIYSLLPINLNQQNCGQCYCGEAACVSP